MDAYANSLEDILEFRKGKNEEPLTKLESRMYRKYNGKISWLAGNTSPDLSYDALEMSRKSSKATLGDFKKINKILEKVRSRPNVITFKNLIYKLLRVF